MKLKRKELNLTWEYHFHTWDICNMRRPSNKRCLSEYATNYSSDVKRDFVKRGWIKFSNICVFVLILCFLILNGISFSPVFIPISDSIEPDIWATCLRSRTFEYFNMASYMKPFDQRIPVNIYKSTNCDSMVLCKSHIFFVKKVVVQTFL